MQNVASCWRGEMSVGMHWQHNDDLEVILFLLNCP